MNYKVCVYTICKNEEKNIYRWYASVKNADQIVVIDTGSTDNTGEKLKECGQNLYFETFIQEEAFDFSKARNYALNVARKLCNNKYRWIYISLDLDEFLEETAIEKIKLHWSNQFDTMRISNYVHGEQLMDLAHRIHSDDLEWSWHRPIHEMLKHSKKTMEQWTIGPSCTYYIHDQDLNKPRNYYEKLKYHYLENPNDIRTVLYLAWEAFEHSELENAFQYSSKLIELILNNSADELYLNYQTLIQAYLNCAKYWRLKENYQKELVELNSAIKICLENKFPMIRHPYILRAFCKTRLQDLSGAIQDYKIALHTKQLHDCWVEENYLDSFIMSNISTAYYYLRKYDEAVYYAELAVMYDDNDQYKKNLDFCRKVLSKMKENYNKKIVTTKNKICIYAICKNEKQFVEQWLDSMSEADYIVVLDTGSTDGTYEMLKNDPRVFRCEQKVIDPWRFDVARNESMKLIPDDANILFCTDLDELLDKGWANTLRENWIEGYHSRCYYKFAWSHTEGGEPARILDYGKIHNRDWHWIYPVHEGLALKENNKFIRQDQILQLGYSIFLHHWPDWTKSRSSYLDLLKLRVEENPEDYESKIYLAHEYYYSEQYDNSIKLLKNILKHHNSDCSNLEKANCYLIMGDSYSALDELGIAMGCYSQAIMIDECYRDPYFSLGYCLNNLNEYEHAILILEKCLEKTKRYYSWLERDRAWAEGIYDLLGVAYYWVGRYEDSYWATSEALKFDPNNERLKENLNYAKEKLELK